MFDEVRTSFLTHFIISILLPKRGHLRESRYSERTSGRLPKIWCENGLHRIALEFFLSQDRTIVMTSTFPSRVKLSLSPVASIWNCFVGSQKRLLHIKDIVVWQSFNSNSFFPQRCVIFLASLPFHWDIFSALSKRNYHQCKKMLPKILFLLS